ncbi:MAG: hypothetical protein LBJ75_00595 [Puniceicoccales bacterium]|nr:hypothetical protein [Puniceicoccales bacterium]
MTPFRLCGIDFGAAAKNGRKYFNRRAEMYDGLRMWIADGGKLPNNSRLATELMAIELNDRKEGRLMLQPKHKLSKSPDLADACALTMCKDGILGGQRSSALSIRPMF